LSESARLAAAMSTAAHAWLATLSDEQRATAQWDFETQERGNWHYAPRRRNGLPLRAMTDAQRAAAERLLTASLSDQGTQKARAIMALEEVLHIIEGGRGHTRDPLNYAFTMFGDPTGQPWGWRIEGHHLIVNATVAGSGAVAITPNFWGSNPARIPFGEREGERVLESEYHVALELAQTLSPGQQRDAVFAQRSVGNIITERGRGRALLHPTGLSCADLSAEQVRLLTTLLASYVDNVPPEIASPYRQLATRDLGQLRLAWAGGMSEGEPFYYRIHGPRLIIEFDCTPNDANHIHSVWRDPRNDWGRDVLGEHYRRHHDDD
jgi:hypothetical protein